MFDAITRLFTRSEEPVKVDEPRIAVAALLVHLAAVDGSVKPEERKAIEGVLIDSYDLSDAEVEKLIAEATRRDNEAVDFYRFTSELMALDEAERVEIVRMMWQVVFADDKNHELEDNMVWRIAELLGVSARQRTVLRNQMARGGAAAEKPA
ncbi:TerB family tellurite resistance protein [Arsenicitalea aurantiaca]|uniref:TerB family tellurite resistance protein n=1 Tax=Arsenicitalea aurantiaca TaxID=1783274 RepID=A0A433X5K3_9HYPH|nr:TerB family tellurite resistance protein [Arsenicitalea aurantiaca]RUT29360.1 TerB family tellurite resistance protein [Arsenicitalea aurantiaca]